MTSYVSKNNKFLNSFSKNHLFKEVHVSEDKVTGVLGVMGHEVVTSFGLEKGQPVHFVCDCHRCKDNEPCVHGKALLARFERGGFFVGDEVDDSESKASEVLKGRIRQVRRAAYEVHANESLSYLDKQKKEYHSLIQTNLQSDTYTLEPQVRIEPYSGLEVSYKIGSDKKYVVKSIDNFVDYFANHEAYTYGKGYNFIHDEKYLDEEGLVQLAFIRKAKALNDKENTNNSGYYYSNTKIGRSIRIGEELLDDFFDTYKELNVEGLNLYDNEMKIPLMLEKEDDYYIYTLDKLDYVKGKCHLYKIGKDKEITIERIPLDKEGKVLGFINSFSMNQFVVREKDFEDFYKYIYSNVSDYFDVDGQVEMSLKVYEYIKIYGDLDEEG
ncbi:MAG: hypothetical protein HUJ56_10690, partial [Erysipelotrichaceae bacterium]|nr:hypothetical protein [Erysipelotrichaceae bacterium]